MTEVTQEWIKTVLKGMTAGNTRLGKRFDKLDSKFDKLDSKFDKKIDRLAIQIKVNCSKLTKIDKRLDKLDSKFDTLIDSLSK